MSEDYDRPDSGSFDPLTAPYWPNVDDSSWTTPIVEEFVVFENVESPTSAPTPPDVDEILRGEYTGWIPLIKAGESFEEAKARAQGAAERAIERERMEQELRIAEAARAEEKLRRAQEERALAEQRLESEQNQIEQLPVDGEPSFESPSEDLSFTEMFVTHTEPAPIPEDLVEDPDTASSPAQALEAARQRIADLRRNFEHQRFLSNVGAMSQPTVPRVVDPEPLSEPVVVEEPANDKDDFVIDTVVNESAYLPPQPDETYVLKSVTDVYEHSSFAQNNQSASVELMIMRDEVRDLRERLDASQKLMQDMMIRFADLAELAIRNKN